MIRNPLARTLPFALLAALVLSAGLAACDLLKQPEYVDVDIVDELLDPTRTLSPTAGTTRIPSPTPVPTAHPLLGPAITISPHNGALPWVNGISRVYVVDYLPIRRVERKDPLVENILVFGVDTRSSTYVASRTDLILVLTLDRRHDVIKLSSILRDTEVTVPGLPQGVKLTEVYGYGGVGLLVNTLNETFDLDLQKFVTVDMLGAERVIDAAGGIPVTVSAAEMHYINVGVYETNRFFKAFSEPVALLSAPGLQTLNGRQTVAYGRIRKVGTDTQRTARQREVLSVLIDRYRSTTPGQRYELLKRSLASLSTNLDCARLATLLSESLVELDTIRQFRIPQNGTFTVDAATQNLIIDRAATSKALHDFLWE